LLFQQGTCRIYNCTFLVIILSPVYDNKKENWRILTNKEIYAMVKKSTITETIRLNRLHWFGHVQRMGENRIPQKSIMYEFGSN
jgi:hypothetical protein